MEFSKDSLIMKMKTIASFRKAQSWVFIDSRKPLIDLLNEREISTPYILIFTKCLPGTYGGGRVLHEFNSLQQSRDAQTEFI